MCFRFFAKESVPEYRKNESKSTVLQTERGMNRWTYLLILTFHIGSFLSLIFVAIMLVAWIKNVLFL